MKINNLQKANGDYIVVREVDGEYWYWGTFQTEHRAREVAHDIGGYVIERSEIDVQ